MASALLSHSLTDKSVHLCIDMQGIFAAGGPWETPWMDRVLPVVIEIAERFPERTMFTRFMTPERPEDMPGMWQHYYRRWRNTTLEHVDKRLLDLLPALAEFVPPATVIDKTRYSAFTESQLQTQLCNRGADALIITGSETDVCVLATVLDAVDLGYRVILVRDAVCSSSDEGHDALMQVYHRRYAQQIETADAEAILSHWR
jgi:nicotinamidase-related amidase